MPEVPDNNLFELQERRFGWAEPEGAVGAVESCCKVPGILRLVSTPTPRKSVSLVGFPRLAPARIFPSSSRGVQAHREKAVVAMIFFRQSAAAWATTGRSRR